jgi:hypothetical protein
MNLSILIQKINKLVIAPRHLDDGVPLIYLVDICPTAQQLTLKGYRYIVSKLNDTFVEGNVVDDTRFWVGHYNFVYGRLDGQVIRNNTLWPAGKEPSTAIMLKLSRFYYNPNRPVVEMSFFLDEEELIDLGVLVHE